MEIAIPEWWSLDPWKLWISHSLLMHLDHRFYQKWAVINDPKDTRAGIKGFVKCNISVIARGDIMSSIPTTSTSQNEDIEKWVGKKGV